MRSNTTYQSNSVVELVATYITLGTYGTLAVTLTKELKYKQGTSTKMDTPLTLLTIYV